MQSRDGAHGSGSTVAVYGRWPGPVRDLGNTDDGDGSHAVVRADDGEFRVWVNPSASPVAKTAHNEKLSAPIKFLLELRDYWHLSETDLVPLLGFTSTDSGHVSRILDGSLRLEDDAESLQARVAHLIWIWTVLRSVFRDRRAENEWLREEHPTLRGRSPLSLMLDKESSNLVTVRDYVTRLGQS